MGGQKNRQIGGTVEKKTSSFSSARLSDLGDLGGFIDPVRESGCPASLGKAVGWVERSEPHQFLDNFVVGLAALDPPYILHTRRFPLTSGGVTRYKPWGVFCKRSPKTWNGPVHFLWIDGNHDQAYQGYVDWSPLLVPGARVALHDAHPRYGLDRVARDAYRMFNFDAWTRLEHVKGILTGVRNNAG